MLALLAFTLAKVLTTQYLLLAAVGLCVLGIVLRAWWPGKGAHTHPDKGDAA